MDPTEVISVPVSSLTSPYSRGATSERLRDRERCAAVETATSDGLRYSLARSEPSTESNRLYTTPAGVFPLNPLDGPCRRLLLLHLPPEINPRQLLRELPNAPAAVSMILVADPTGEHGRRPSCTAVIEYACGASAQDALQSARARGSFGFICTDGSLCDAYAWAPPSASAPLARRERGLLLATGAAATRALAVCGLASLDVRDTLRLVGLNRVADANWADFALTIEFLTVSDSAAAHALLHDRVANEARHRRADEMPFVVSYAAPRHRPPLRRYVPAACVPLEARFSPAAAWRLRRVRHVVHPTVIPTLASTTNPGSSSSSSSSSSSWEMVDLDTELNPGVRPRPRCRREPWGWTYPAAEWTKLMELLHIDSVDPFWHHALDFEYDLRGDINLRKLSRRRPPQPCAANLWMILGK